MIHGAHHISLATADMDRLLGFYRDLLGLRQTSEALIEPGSDVHAAFTTVVALPSPRVRSARLDAGNIEIELFEYREPAPAPGEAKRACDVGIRHIAFDVTDIDGDHARLVAAGVPSLSQPTTMGPHGLRSVYLRDPDGNIVELQEILPGSRASRAHVKGLPG